MTEEEKINAVNEIISYAKSKFNLPCFVFGDAVYSVEEATEAMLDNMEDEMKENGWTLEQYVEARKKDAEVMPLKDYLRGVYRSGYCDDKIITILKEQTPEKESFHAVINFIDDYGRIIIDFDYSTYEDPYNANIYNVDGHELKLVSYLECDTSVFVDGKHVNEDWLVWDNMVGFFPIVPYLAEEDLDTESLGAVLEYKKDDDEWYIDDKRGLANEWTVYLCKSKETIEYAKAKGWRNISDKHAADCISRANDSDIDMNCMAVIIVENVKDFEYE